MAANGSSGELRFRSCSKCGYGQTLVTVTHEMEAFFRQHGRNSFDVAKRMIDEDQSEE